MDRRYRDTAHLFSRAGFGAVRSEVLAHQNKPWDELVDLVLDTSRAPALGPQPNLHHDRDWYDKYVDMVHYWLNRCRRPVTQAPVVEKMTLFWHGYLCSSIGKVQNHQAMFAQNHLFRKHGLGNVKDLMWRTSIDPAMLLYLDNRRNTVRSPNENFSRELMELFVTGVGHYSEADVRESARAWTGHGVDDNDRYRFSPADHDSGAKTFLGQRGNWDGRDIIELLFRHRRQAHTRFFAHKLWSFFAYPVSINHPVVSDIAATYNRNLNAAEALRAVFMHSGFRSDDAYYGLMRSPIEYAVALMRHTRFDCATARPEWYLREMGQEPFRPPDVSGWRPNDYWITESAIWARGDMVGHLRWKTYSRGDLEDVKDVVSWKPLTFKYTVDQAVDMALDNYDMALRSSASRKALTDYVVSERNSESAWGQRSGLLMLPLLTPDVQLA
ncbi:MAG: DUF1800 domain-containing protein [Acidimicrobiia bacterium]|nr:DUF1800 domain-containing protein [Acidimicrobiia bacterium]MDH5520939.1 DUF1800 domain-containing protein [Acidimicrobiia bacterium]